MYTRTRRMHYYYFYSFRFSCRPRGPRTRVYAVAVSPARSLARARALGRPTRNLPRVAPPDGFICFTHFRGAYAVLSADDFSYVRPPRAPYPVDIPPLRPRGSSCRPRRRFFVGFEAFSSHAESSPLKG